MGAHAQAWGFVVLCFASSWSRAALADTGSDSDLVLGWSVADGCPDGAAARKAIDSLLGERRSRGHAPPRAQVNVVITQRGDGRFEAQVSVHDVDASVERRFDGARCSNVAQAATLIVAMTLEPMSAAERMPAAAPASLPPTATEVTPTSAERVQIAIGVGALGDTGSLPQPSMGVTATLAVDVAATRLEVNASQWLARLALRGPHPDDGGEIGLISGGLQGCYDMLRGVSPDFALAPCLGGEVGSSAGQAQGRELENPRSRGALWVAVLASLTLRQRTASSVGWWFSAGAGVPVIRPNFVIKDFPQPVFQAAPVVGRASIGLTWSFR